MDRPSIPVFVFGSNRVGLHGRGAARWAFQHRGAIARQGEGRQGDAYGIPTKETPYETLSILDVRNGVDRFIAYASDHQNETFEVTPIGCGLAGFRPEQIAPMFNGAPANCWLPDEFLSFVATRPPRQAITIRRGDPSASVEGWFDDEMWLVAVPQRLQALVLAAEAKGWHIRQNDPLRRRAMLWKARPPAAVEEGAHAR